MENDAVKTIVTGELLTVRDIATMTGLHRSEIYTIMQRAKIEFVTEKPKTTTIDSFLTAFEFVVNMLHHGTTIKKLQLHNALEDIKDYNFVIRKFSLNLLEINE